MTYDFLFLDIGSVHRHKPIGAAEARTMPMPRLFGNKGTFYSVPCPSSTDVR